MILDAFPPNNTLMSTLLKLWLDGIMPWLAGLFADRRAYQYLAASIQGAVPVQGVCEMMVRHGCEKPVVTLYTLGAAGRIMAQKKMKA